MVSGGSLHDPPQALSELGGSVVTLLVGQSGVSGDVEKAHRRQDLLSGMEAGTIERTGNAVDDVDRPGMHLLSVVHRHDGPGAGLREAERSLTPAPGSIEVYGAGVAEPGMEAAIEEALLGLAEGGIPIGSALVIGHEIVGRGHNRRVQQGSAILHGEMDALENAGRLPAARYRWATIFTTLSPCDMCAGAILLYGIPRVVVGENRTFLGAESHLRSRGVEVEVLDDQGCIDLMTRFIAENPSLWNEDIGLD